MAQPHTLQPASRLEGLQGFVVVGFGGDFRDEFAVNDFAGLVEDDDGAGEQAG